MPDPRITDLPAWLRLQGRIWPETPPDEAEWCGVLNAAAAEIERLRAEAGRLREILRVNLLRHAPGATHAAIDALLGEPVGPTQQPREIVSPSLEAADSKPPRASVS